MSCLPRPDRLGAPAQYKKWRPGQDELLLRALDSKKRFVGLVLPTGSGKSLMNVCAHLLTGYRAAVLTATRVLQNQYADLYPNVTDVRGAANYPCHWNEISNLQKPYYVGNCSDAPCHDGHKCPGVRSGCEYFDAVRRAKLGKLINSNYQYWMSSHYYGDGLGRTELLMCDEAHSAPDELSRFLRIVISRKALGKYLPQLRGGGRVLPTSAKIQDWRRWAGVTLRALKLPPSEDVRAGRATAPPSDMQELGKQLRALKDAEGEWVVDRPNLAFEPLWPAPYAERILFRGAKKVLFTSATMRDKTLELMGLGADDYELIEAPSTFPVQNRRVLCIPGVKLNFRSTMADMLAWVATIDRIIINRVDRKGIIHVVSYERGRFLMQHSRFRHLMVAHTRDNTEQVVRAFKAAKRPVILVSPSATTGWDFPDDECRYQIIGKIAFSDSRDPITKARAKSDKLYGFYLAMVDIVQAAGRGNRSARDWCETFIVDDNAKWFLWYYKQFAPASFLESVEWRRGPHAIPDPPPMERTA